MEEKLLESFEKFKTYKIAIEGKSESSVNQYIYRIQNYLEFHNIKTYEDFINKNASQVKEWLTFLTQNNNQERSRNIRLTAIKEVYRYFKKELKENIDEEILDIPFAKVPKRQTHYLEDEDFFDLLATITDSRVKTGMAIIFQTGVRFCELVQITCTDIERGYADVIGKGNKERRIWFDLWVKEIARQYIEGKRRDIIKKTGKQIDILMISNEGNVLKRRKFEDSMKLWAKKYNENIETMGRLDWWQHFSPHKLRHSFATIQLRNGNDIATVRDEMGHANIATTNNYAHSNQEMVRMAMLNKTGKKKEEENREKENLMKAILENEEIFNKVKELVETYGKK